LKQEQDLNYEQKALDIADQIHQIGQIALKQMVRDREIFG